MLVLQLRADRRSTTTRPAHEAELEDIVSTIDSLDTRNNLNNVVFAAVLLKTVTPTLGVMSYLVAWNQLLDE